MKKTVTLPVLILLVSAFIAQAQISSGFIASKTIAENKNDCIHKNIQNGNSVPCTENLYSTGCDLGDGLIAWSLENVDVPNIPCEGTPPWYHDYTDQMHMMHPGDYTLTVTASYSSTNFDVWIDFNNDLLLTDDELVLDDAACADANVPYTFTITVPASASPGEHILRFRTNWIDNVNDPCETYSYGNCCDFSVEIFPPLIMDVGVESIDMLDFYEPGTIIPKATIKNYGMGTWTFDAVMNSGNYSSTVEITDLIPGTTEQVIFDTINAGVGSFIVEVCTQLEGDENPINDCKAKPIIVNGGQVYFAYLAEDLTGTLVEGPVKFNPAAPGEIIQIAPTSSNDIITGACWVGDFWWGCQQGGGYYLIDHENGNMAFFGTTAELNGLATGGGEFFLGVSDSVLYELNPLMGLEFEVGPLGNAGGQMMGIATDVDGNVFGFDVGDDMFYSIDGSTGAATAIGPLGFDFEGPQDMAIDKYTGACYILGYTGNTCGLYAVDVSTGAASLLSEFPSGIHLSALAIPYTYVPPVGPPPQGFDAMFVEDVGVECSWGMGPPPPTWLGYDDGVNAGGLGSSGGGTFYVAIRFDAEDLLPFNGNMITAFKFFPLKFANNSDLTFKIWEDTNASFLIYEQVLENLDWNEWNTIPLDEPQTINASKELWVGFEVTHPVGEDPIGRDDGPAVTGYGDMVSLDGTTWESLSAVYNLDFNYNLKISVEEFQEAEINAGRNDPGIEFIGVNIYRDGDLVNSNPVQPPEMEYIDTFFDPGTYTYTAKAVYDEGLSDPTPGVEVVIPGAPEISVNPDSLYEFHENPPQITTQELTITNTGDEPLEWEIEIDFENNKTKSQKIVANAVPEYCDASTTTEDEWIANVLCGSIDNSSGWQGGVADYTDISTSIPAGASQDITITNGNAWAADIVTCWVDWNMDYEFGVGTNEEFFTENVGGTGGAFTGEIIVPAGTPSGDYRMRVRMTYSTAPQPCGNASYGEVEDYTINVGGGGDMWLSVDPMSGTIGGGDSETLTVTFDSENLNIGVYAAMIVIESNDMANPTVEVPVALFPDGEPPAISWSPDSFTFALGEDEEDTQELEVSNVGAGMLECTMSITYGQASSPVVQPHEYEHMISSDQLGLANTGMETPSPNVTEDEVIRYDDGVNNDAIGLTAGGTFEVSAYWPAATMSQYSGMELTHVEVYINDLPDPFVLRIYDAGTPTVPGALLHEETVSVTALNWNLIELSEPVEITGDDIWIGYEVTHAEGEFVAGCDAGPAVAGFGDMISLDGVTFEPMSGLGLNYNWNIAATLTGEATVNWLSISPLSGSIPGGDLALFDVTAITNELPNGISATYYASIWMENTDPDNPMVEVPVILDYNPWGLEEGENGAAYIMMFPNPAKEIVNISTNYEINQVAVLNQAGKVVLEKAISGKSVQLNTNSLQAGVYFIKIQSSAGESVNKLIIQ